MNNSINKLRVTFLAHYYDEIIDMLYSSAVEAKLNLKAKLEKDLTDIVSDNVLSEEEKHELESYISDELFLSEKTTELAGEMMIVALYKTIEIAIKDMLRVSRLFTDIEMKKFSQADKLKKQIKNKICDTETLKGYHAYNELRLINNCIKHSGLVNDKLSATYPSWKKNEKLQNLDKSYFRLKNDVNVFIKLLRDNVLAKM
jgi:hypothetical protein